MSRILLIEDDEFIRRVYERAFRLRGHALTLSADGKIALNDLSMMDPLPDAIILDVVMPGMRGDELLRTLKSDDRYKHIPVAMLTNSVHADKGPEYISKGASLYLIKIDHTPKDLISKIEALINMSSRAGAKT